MATDRDASGSRFADGFDSIAYINAPRWRHSSLGLERIALLLSKLGNPQDDFASVHVAGTNGKGSVCSYLASVLQAAGLRTGLFTSPYIERFEERICVGGEVIGRDELLDVTCTVRDAAEEVEEECGEHPNEFELMCAIAFVHFSRMGCDIAVVEVGLGGRLDATNVISPILCVITRIGLDHTDLLGDTLGAIATEKAGIVKRGVPVVSWPQANEAALPLRARCAEMGSRLDVVDFSLLRIGPIDPASLVREFSYEGVPYVTRLLATYQPENAAVAIEAARVLRSRGFSEAITDEAIGAGIARAEWPGRFEVVCRHPLVIVDGAHNPQGAEGLARSLDDFLGEGAQATLVVGVLGDKDRDGILSPLLRFARRVIVYAPDNPRALDAGELAEGVRRLVDKTHAGHDAMAITVAASPGDAILEGLQKEGPDGTVVAFGTLYAIGEIKQTLRGCRDRNARP